MNDWLEYQGSGSSRAYIAHYGVKGMKWDPSKLFGKPQETNKQKVEQIKANDKLVSALYEQYNKYEEEYGEANMNYKELDNILIPKQQQKIIDAKDMLKELETKYSNLSKSSPLEATQRYSRNIWAQKKNIQELESGLEQLKKTQMDYKRKMEIASVKADDVHKKITEAEGDSAAISRSRRIKQSYFDMPADEFIMHTEKGGLLMNDWLDYQGSGSSRAYTNDTLSHAAPMKNTTSNSSSSAYDNINKKLDAFYTALQKNMSLKRQAFTMVNSFAEKARETKSKATLAAADTRRVNAMYGSLISDVDSFSGSQLQKTALKNKFDRMVSNYETQLAAVTRTRTDFNTATLDTLVDEIMSNDIRVKH